MKPSRWPVARAVRVRRELHLIEGDGVALRAVACAWRNFVAKLAPRRRTRAAGCGPVGRRRGGGWRSVRGKSPSGRVVGARRRPRRAGPNGGTADVAELVARFDDGATLRACAHGDALVAFCAPNRRGGPVRVGQHIEVVREIARPAKIAPLRPSRAPFAHPFAHPFGSPLSAAAGPPKEDARKSAAAASFAARSTSRTATPWVRAASRHASNSGFT